MSEQQATKPTEGAVGAGIVLVLVPVAALVLGMDKISGDPIVGLPILAIFGIMILFGAMSLTSTLFARLSISDAREALALPAGSIRATIALSLIVLFAIIAIMLFQSLAKPYSISGLSEEDKKVLLSQPGNRVLAVLPSPCTVASATAGATPSSKTCFEVRFAQSASQEAVDIAKQLLILIGTLMTSVTSFYFASRASAPPKPSVPYPEAQKQRRNQEVESAGTQDDDHEEGEEGGSSNELSVATRDEDLPEAKGGVEK